jgi:hypothetical protein
MYLFNNAVLPAENEILKHEYCHLPKEISHLKTGGKAPISTKSPLVQVGLKAIW